MKTRRMLIIVLIIALLVVYYLIGTDYLKQRNQQETLTGRVADTTQALALVPQPPADLGERLAAAQAGLEEEAGGALAIDTNLTHIVNGILQQAVESGVKAIPLATQPWAIESVSGQDYAVFRIDIEASGTYAQLTGFIARLESGEPGTMIIEYLNIERAPGAFLLESDAAAALPVTAQIKIAVYTNPRVVN